ncbi:MAG: class I SAM-dependent methyltransferase [Chloroflexota bacterium]
MDTIEQLQSIDWNFPHSNRASSIHSIHPYPAKFIPEIPRNLIEILGLPHHTCVFDPFCGSGVTLVEAQKQGYTSIGVDINPIACLISRVKTTPLTDDIRVLAETIVSNAKNHCDIASIPAIPNLDHWFQKDIQYAIASLLAQIAMIRDSQAQDAVRLALSSILVKVSNQESDTRYAAIHKPYQADDVYIFFQQAVLKIWQALGSPVKTYPKATIIEKNILDVSSQDVPHPVGLVITSPPYPNAYEYWLYHKYRMFWLGHDPQPVKAQEIGARAHYFKKNAPTVDDFKKQIESIFQLLHHIVVSGGYICFVIGRSKIHGQIIDNAALIQEVGRQLGFDEITTLERVLSKSRKSFNLSHANIKKEHILIFRRP